MQMRGIRVDHKAISIEKENLTKKIERLKLELNEACGREINGNSSTQLQEYFYKEIGLKPYYVGRGADKKITTNERALIRIQRKGYDEARIILDIRRAIKRKSTYVEFKTGTDGRLHFSLNPVGTSFGRLSSGQDIYDEGLNAQTIPKEVKHFFLADEGYIMYDVDKAQAENRVVAYIAPDINMRDAFEKGKDIHSRTAGMIFGIPEEEVSRVPGSANLANPKYSQRDVGKESNHAFNYGRGYKTFAIDLEIPEREAKAIREGYFRGYPGVLNYRNWILNIMKNPSPAKRTLVNCFGRRFQVMNHVNDGNVSTVLFYIPQSTVADIINHWGLLHIWDNPIYKGLELLNQVHDSIVFQIPISLGVDVHLKMLKNITSSLNQDLYWDGTRFNIPSDIKMGTCYGKLEELKAGRGMELNSDDFVSKFKKFAG